jgi:gluconokinase
MNYFLAVDIGTTSVKAIAFDEKGMIINNRSIGYKMQHPQPAYSEQQVTQIFDAVILSINQITEALLPANPRFVSFSSMMHSLIAVDKKGEPLTNCIIWADNRAAGIAAGVRSTAEGQRFYHATGVPIHAMSPFCKLLWMKEHEPQVFQNAYKFIGIKEYIFLKLFDVYVVDTGIASATGLLNRSSLQWDTAVLEMLNLPEEKLSAIVAVESIFYYEQKSSSCPLLNLPDKTPFVIGGSDGALANLGAGSTANNSVSATIGTSAAIRVLSNKPVTEEDMSVFCYHAIDDLYIIGGASNNGAIVLQWLRESLLQTSESYAELFSLAESVSAGSNDLFLIPYILGERAPVWNSEARGIYFGLTINHTKAHLVRAAMEGVIYNLYSIGKNLEKRNSMKEIYAAGGFAQSTLWLQILADVFNFKILVSGSSESSALGAVMVGIKALHLPNDIKPVIVSEHIPNTANHEIYQKGFKKFKRIYALMKSEFGSG